jgi:hypothetical protein
MSLYLVVSFLDMEQKNVWAERERERWEEEKRFSYVVDV